MQILVWRVTINDHSALFDDIGVAADFIRGFLGKRPVGEQESKITLESERMDEEVYRTEIEKEDGVKC